MTDSETQDPDSEPTDACVVPECDVSDDLSRGEDDDHVNEVVVQGVLIHLIEGQHKGRLFPCIRIFDFVWTEMIIQCIDQFVHVIVLQPQLQGDPDSVLFRHVEHLPVDGRKKLQSDSSHHRK